jgi:hypothetical protein
MCLLLLLKGMGERGRISFPGRLFRFVWRFLGG